MSTSSLSSRPGSATSSILANVPGAFPDVHTPLGEHHSLQDAIHARRAEYVRPKNIRIKVGTWNVASYKGAEKDVGAWFVESRGISAGLTGLDICNPENDRTKPSVETVNEQEARFAEDKTSVPRNDPGIEPSGGAIDLYLLGLQEIVDINSATEALRPYTDPGVAAKWKSEIADVLSDHVLVAEQQLLGLLLLVYASPRVADDVTSVSTTSVGTGLMGVMGNKGAVTARFVLGDTTRLVFINAHLAAGAEKASLDRRNWDYSQIMTRTRFDPVKTTTGLQSKTGELIDDADFAFVVGDLNYRITDIPADDIRRLLTVHTRDEYDLAQPSSAKIERELEQSRANSTISPTTAEVQANDADTDSLDPSDDPASLQTTINSLLSHDELLQQIQTKKAFHEGWREGQITFLPTYKYDQGTVGMFDSSEKRRAPSWCDRILYRSRRDRLRYMAQAADEAAAKVKDEEMKKNGIDQAGNDEDLLYDYDPDAEDQDDNIANDQHVTKPPDDVVITNEGFSDELHLETYTSHQRVLSSDHKPIHALFTLKYDAVVPELRTKIQQEVARELDRAENDGRPAVTVVVDKTHRDEPEVTDEHPAEFEGVYFGHVKYGRSKHRGLTIANTGRVPANISFVDRPVGAGQLPGRAPIWLAVTMNDQRLEHGLSETAYTQTLEPGEACNIQLDLRILDGNLVQGLNEGVKTLDDILVLRVENGRDHFIPVYGKWQQSTLGRSIDKLIRIPEGGLRKLQHQHPDDRASEETDLPVKWSAPRELFRLTEALENMTEACLASWEMTAGDEMPPWIQYPGWPFCEAKVYSIDDDGESETRRALCAALDEETAIQDAFEADAAPSMQLQALGAFVTEFIQHIPDGIVTAGMWSELDQALAGWETSRGTVPSKDDQRAMLQEVLSQSPPHSVSFVLVTSTLDRMIGEICTAARGRLEIKAEKAAQTTTPSRLGSLRRRTVVKDPFLEFRESTIRTIAAAFGRAMIRGDASLRGRDRNTWEERRTRLVELFISSDSA